MKEIEFDYILQWWLREPQPPGTRASATKTTENESLSHRFVFITIFCNGGFECLSHRFAFVASSASATGKDISGTVSFLWLREPQPPRTTAQPPFRLASRASATKTTEVKSILIFLPVPFNFP